MMLRVNNQHGDTIVEVMIVLAILGFALSISYATANRSLLNTRQAQESSQATEYAESQVEDLYDLAPASTPGDTTNNIFAQTTPYCIMDSSGTLTIQSTESSCTFGSIPYQVLIYNCDEPLSGIPRGTTNPCGPAVGGPVVASSDTLIVQVTWPDVMGDGTDSSTLVWRGHYTTTPAVAAAAAAPSPTNVSWWNNGGLGACAPTTSCSLSSGPDGEDAPSSMVLASNANITFNYTVQPPPDGPCPDGELPGSCETVPEPGDSGLTLKLCYAPPPTGSYPINVYIGGVLESSLSGNLDGSNVDSAAQDPSCPNEAQVNSSMPTIPAGNGTTTLTITLGGSQPLTLYNVTIYS